MCVEFWCLAHLRWDSSGAPIYSCTLTSGRSVTANITSSRSVEYSNNYYVKMTLILNKVSKVLYIDVCMFLATHFYGALLPPKQVVHASRLWNGLILYICSSKSVNYSNNNKEKKRQTEHVIHPDWIKWITRFLTTCYSDFIYQHLE